MGSVTFAFTSDVEAWSAVTERLRQKREEPNLNDDVALRWVSAIADFKQSWQTLNAINAHRSIYRRTGCPGDMEKLHSLP